MNCPCYSGIAYAACCEPYHTKEKNAPTAEALMRSRYAAYALPNGDYLYETTYPSKRHLHDVDEMQAWGESNTWLGLEIVRKVGLSVVEFKARFLDADGQEQLHHEISEFKKRQNRWYYVTGEFVD